MVRTNKYRQKLENGEKGVWISLKNKITKMLLFASETSETELLADKYKRK